MTLTPCRQASPDEITAMQVRIRRAIMRNTGRIAAAQIIAAEWLSNNGSNSDRGEAHRVLLHLCGRAYFTRSE